MSLEREIEESFPQLQTLEDESLRNQVVAVWATAIEQSKYDTLAEIEWFAEVSDEAPDKLLTTHVNDVADVALGICDTLSKRHDLPIDRDAVCAGALLHDVSKLAEESDDDIKRMVPHPHYVIHQLADAGVSPHVQHIALAHTERTNVPPMTQEAHIVHHADYLAAQAIYRAATGKLPAEETLVPSKDA